MYVGLALASCLLQDGHIPPRHTRQKWVNDTAIKDQK